MAESISLANISIDFTANTAALDKATQSLKKMMAAVESTQNSINQFGNAQKSASRSTRTASDSMDRAHRELRSLKSSLGGAERAAAQFERAQEQLNRAVTAGVIDQREYNRLLALARTRFSTAEVKSRDLRNNFRKLNSVMQTGARRFLAFQAALAAVAGAAGLTLLVKRSIDAADAIAKTADKIGISTDALQEYRFAADLAGVSQGQLDQGLAAFTKRLGELRQGTGALYTRLKDMDSAFMSNVASAKSVSEALDLIFRKARGMKDAADRAALMATAFGRTAGIDMTNMIDGVDEAIQKARELGLVIREDLLRNAEDTKDKLSILGKVLSTKLATAILENSEAIGRLADALTEAIPKIIDFVVASGKAFGLLDETPLEKLNKQIKAVQDQIDSFTLPRTVAGGQGPLSIFMTAKERAAELAKLNAELDRLKANAVALRSMQTFRSTYRTPPASDDAGTPKAPTLPPMPEPIEVPSLRANVPDWEEWAKWWDAFNKSLRDTNLQRMASELNEVRNIVSSTKSPLERYTEELDRLAYLTSQYPQYADAFKRAQEDALDALIYSDPYLSTLSRGFDSLGAAMEDAALAGEEAMDALKSSVRAAVNDMLSDFLKLTVLEPFKKMLFSSAISLLSGGSSSNTPLIPVPSYATGGTSALPTFATGGSFTVGGIGGTDSQLVQFKATPGEQVTVSTPGGESQEMQPPIIQNVYIETGVSQTVRAEMLRLLPAIKQETVAGVVEARQRSPRIFSR